LALGSSATPLFFAASLTDSEETKVHFSELIFR
jgi:hypothetical protein